MNIAHQPIWKNTEVDTCSQSIHSSVNHATQHRNNKKQNATSAQNKSPFPIFHATFKFIKKLLAIVSSTNRNIVTVCTSNKKKTVKKNHKRNLWATSASFLIVCSEKMQNDRTQFRVNLPCFLNVYFFEERLKIKIKVQRIRKQVAEKQVRTSLAAQKMILVDLRLMTCPAI